MINSLELIDATFKDSTPLKTIEKIKGILAENGIKTTEHWYESNVPYCYSLSLFIEDTGFSSNGKGLTREFALASAYGELIERIQLGFVGRMSTQKDGLYSYNDSQDIVLPAQQLLEGDLSWCQKLPGNLLAWSGIQKTAEEIMMQYADKQQNFTVTPYFDLVTGNVAYVPSRMRKALYTSNGCAAGNTMEEAVVQSFGEIVERNHSMRIIRDRICVPDVPEEVLKQYTIAYDIISFVRSKGYKVLIKDCSLGTKFPVVCACFIHEKTGRYHTHFGAYPNFEIALTRALTETFQGKSVDSFASHEGFLFNLDENSFTNNLNVQLVFGSSQRMPEFFVGENKLPYNANAGFKGTTNKALMKECIEFFAEQGYRPLLRDSSSLGFPTCQIIIPGYSETNFHRLLKDKALGKYLSRSVRTLRNPKTATMEDMLGCLMHIQELARFSPNAKNGFLSAAKLMADLSPAEETYLLSASLAHIHYTLGQYSLAADYVQNMLLNDTGSDSEFLRCIKRYLDLKLANYPDHQIKELIQLFHTKETAARFYSYIDEKKNPLADFVLSCDMSSCDSCRIQDKCCQKNAQRIIDLVNEKTGQLNFEESAALLKTLI